MLRKETVAMLLAGGQGSRLGVLTNKLAKPAVSFGGKYKIIDFTLSNCINSGIDTVGVLTQYQPLRLNRHIGIGIPWDLDRNYGGVSILPPYIKATVGEWYSGTANAIYQNKEFIDYYNPEYVIILSADHVYKMDYEMMLNFHKERKADLTIAAIQIPIEEAHRYGVIIEDVQNKIIDFEEKPQNPKNNLISMGIYIFNWKLLKSALASNDLLHRKSDFGKHIIPYCKHIGCNIYAYHFDGFWRDVGTLQSYWETNMELVKIVPDFNLYEEFWQIYSNNGSLPPQYTAETAEVKTCIISEAAEVYGKVYNSVIGNSVHIGKDSIIWNSIVMDNCQVGEGCVIRNSILAEEVIIGNGVEMGTGEWKENIVDPEIYNSDLIVIGESSVIPDGVKIGKNSAISGITDYEDYEGGILPPGSYLVKDGVI
ncbi:MAG: glucose-phosphate adenylyltransferase GlgC [Clostridiales bacterium]|jgi:glucose-1-phosphate adenylyltransferase|nr:glucose-phosphate adenylyltransferase GlgC [Clostridiales bacterium]